MENYCGKRLDGRYEIREIIGVGGMAVVYKAYDNIDDRIVAIKILKEEFLANEEFRRRFKNEAKAIAVLSHPNIVKVYDVSFGDRLQYIVMEYIEGITLKEYIEQQKAVNWKEAVHFVNQILKALQHAHDKGIVHRDIKPQNIMLLQDGTIKVSDFGIARFSRGDTRTMTESAIGSVHYISPEQARGEITDDKADLYSVGVVMYEMLTGQLPFQSDSAVSVAIMQLQQDAKRPREINPDIPLGLEQITLRAMQKNARDRYQSASEMLLDLDEFRKNPSIKFDYNYFVDSDPTRFVDPKRVLPAKAPASAVKTEPEEEKDEKEPSKTMPILFGVIAGLVVIIAIFVGVFLGRNAKKVEVPNFVGMNYNDEISGNALYTENFVFETESVYSSEAAPGVVLKQNPDAKTKIRKGKTIKLEIAYNDDSVLISGIVGLSSEEAEAKLKKSGFSVKIIPKYDKNAKEGIVFDTYPVEGSYGEKGSLVTIYVATNDNPDAAVVPNVVGYSQDIAKKLIESAGFKVGNVTEANSDKAKGTVISQSPNGSETADKGAAVALVVSNGVPEATSTTISVKLPKSSGGSGTLKVFLNSTLYNSESEQFPREVSFSGETITITLKGSGANNSYTVVIDDYEIQSGKIDFTKTPAVVTDVQNKEFPIPMINVVGKTVAQAEEDLNAAGFTNITYVDENGQKVASPNDSSKVIDQNPAKDERRTPSSEIRLTIRA